MISRERTKVRQAWPFFGRGLRARHQRNCRKAQWQESCVRRYQAMSNKGLLARTNSKSMEFMNVAPKSGRTQVRARSAFALAEVLVSVALMAIAFISLYAGISSSFAVTKLSRENLRATQI